MVGHPFVGQLLGVGDRGRWVWDMSKAGKKPELAPILVRLSPTTTSRSRMRTFARYFPLYVAEFQSQYNNRKNADIFGTAIKGC